MTESNQFTPDNLRRIANSCINHEAIELAMSKFETQAVMAASKGRFSTSVNVNGLTQPDVNQLILNLEAKGFKAYVQPALDPCVTVSWEI